MGHAQVQVSYRRSGVSRVRHGVRLRVRFRVTPRNSRGEDVTLFAERCSCYAQRQKCHALVLAHRMVRLRVRPTVFRLTLGQGAQAQDS